MPELPDLEAIKGFLRPRLVGVAIQEVVTGQPVVLRQPSVAEFVALLRGNVFAGVERRGKFLLFPMTSGHVLAINFMLTGRLQYCLPAERRHARTCLELSLEDGHRLRYFDDHLMGKVYLVEQLDSIPHYQDMGPEATDEELTLEVFQKRLRRHFGQIKNILVNDTFVTGIGNAYADEILFAAGINPYRSRSRLSPQEVEKLYQATRRVLAEATETVCQRLGEEIHREIRDFLPVHGKGGQPCPRCGNTISQITAHYRLTNFCRRCQA
ncbi:MAG: hypothetical protein HYU86_06895 [Chloroflexi bacterium]|nr:hypothetical protein [Chloroflexota bacterium]